MAEERDVGGCSRQTEASRAQFVRREKSTSHLILIEEHIWNRVAYGKPSRTLRTYQLSFHNVNLKERVVHLPEEALILLCKSEK